VADSLNTSQFRDVLLIVAKKIQDNKDYLCKVDAVIGDGDHGISMAKGFKAVEENIKYKDFGKVSDLLTSVGFSLVENIGGAAGPLFGTVFISAAKVAGDKTEVDLELLQKMFEQSVVDVCKRGGSKLGDKTMIDALQPAVEGLKESVRKDLSLVEGLELAYQKAKEGVEATKNMQPRQGKSRYLRDRALGHQDAGATSISLVFEAMLEGVKK